MLGSELFFPFSQCLPKEWSRALLDRDGRRATGGPAAGYIPSRTIFPFGAYKKATSADFSSPVRPHLPDLSVKLRIAASSPCHRSQ